MLFIIGLVLGAIVVLFVFQNVIPITVTFFAWQFHGTLAFILLLAILAGMLISALLSIPELIKKELKFSHLKKHNQKLAEELEAHKQRLSETEAKIMHTETVVIATPDPVIHSSTASDEQRVGTLDREA